MIVFAKYLSANDLFLATSLTVRLDKPRSVSTPKIPVIESAIDMIPQPSTPKYLAMYLRRKAVLQLFSD